MADLTARILIGHEHLFDKDICPSHVIHLTENDRPALILNSTAVPPSKKKDFKEVIWIPTIENMLEDALLMVTLYLDKAEKFIKLASKYIDIHTKVECYEIPAEGREALYKLLKTYTFNTPLVFTTIQNSTLTSQLERLKEYKVEVEIYVSQDISSGW